MERVTRKQVDEKARLFAKLLGEPYGGEPGSWWLDFTPYGGFNLVKMSDHGSQRQPFGCKRRNQREMFDTLDFACEALRLQAEKGEG